jgi:hypothetical protein
VDHVKDYKPPKDSDKLDDITKALHIQGCGPGVELPMLKAPSSQDDKSNDDECFLLPPEPEPESRLLHPAVKSEPAKNSDRGSGSKRKYEDRGDDSSTREKERSKKSKKKDSKKKKSKKRKSKKHKKKESSSSSSSSSDESSSSSSSEDERDRSNKRKKR